MFIAAAHPHMTKSKKHSWQLQSDLDELKSVKPGDFEDDNLKTGIF